MTAEDRMNGVDRWERELDAELRFDFDMRVAEKMRAGMNQAEARRTTRLEFGGIEQIKEECRDERSLRFLEDFIRDLRYATRSVRRNPGFAALVVLILALGIGANTTVFSVVSAVLLNPLPYRNPAQIVAIANPFRNGDETPLAAKVVSVPDFKDWHNQSSSFSAMAYYYGWEAPVMPGPMAEYARLTRMSAEFFHVFAVQPVVGRPFSSAELTQESDAAVMVSYSYWLNRLGADPHVPGRTMRVYDKSVSVVGVLPAGFDFPDHTDVWFPDTYTGPSAQDRNAHGEYVIARLKPGVPLTQAQTEMTSIASRLEQAYPETNRSRTAAVTRMQDEIVGDVRPTLWLLWGAVSVVLLIACANTATLLLGKAIARTREIALRAALGASRRRLIRQLLTEFMLLASLAGACGLLVAYWATKALVALAPAGVPRLAEASINPRVLAFALGISLATALLFGLIPALHGSKTDLNDALKQAGARTIGGGTTRMRSALVVAEIALAVLLLSSAGLLTKSFVALQSVSLGFQPENVLMMKAAVPAEAEATRFFRNTLSEIAALPGVKAAGATMIPPGHVVASGRYYVDHMPARVEIDKAPHVVFSVIAPHTFEALGIPLVSGRDFNSGDTPDRPMVAIVNQSLAREAFPGKDPIGRTIICTFDSFKGMTIVGVVGDVRERGAAQETMPECYQPYTQHSFNENSLTIVVRTAGNQAGMADALRSVVGKNSGAVPVSFKTLRSDVAEGIAAPEFRTLLFGIFAVLAVSLAMAGVYGVIAFNVRQQSNELGLRMALGADAGSVMRLVLRRGLVLWGLGLALGLAGAAVSARLLRSVLFEVKPNDPVVYLSVAVLMGVVAMTASWIPARRAARIDPLTSIRQE